MRCAVSIRRLPEKDSGRSAPIGIAMHRRLLALLTLLVVGGVLFFYATTGRLLAVCYRRGERQYSRAPQ